MTARADADVEVLPAVEEEGHDLDPGRRLSPELDRAGWMTGSAASIMSTSPRRTASGSILGGDVAHDDAFQVGGMGSPIARVSAKDELLPALDVLDEEGTAPDRSARLRVVDSVLPDLAQVLTGERVRAATPTKRGIANPTAAIAKNDADGLRIERTHAADARQVILKTASIAPELRAIPEERLLREDEVPRRDRHAVAPARLRTDAVPVA